LVVLTLAVITWNRAVGPTFQPAARPATATAEEPAAVFAWFDTLGFPDVKDKPFVRVATGQQTQSGGGGPRNTYVPGFLTEENADSFTYISLSLAPRTLRKTPAHAPEHESVGFEPVDLARYARSRLESLRSSAAREDGERRFWEIGYGRRTETFVLAWACWRNGLEDAAHELFELASGMPPYERSGPDDPPGPPLREFVAEEVAHHEMWRAVLAFEDPTVSRTQLLDRFERIVKTFPDSKHHARAVETTNLLRQMVREDDEFAAKKPIRNFEKLSKDEQAAEWVFRLRDQNGHQTFEPGGCDVFTTDDQAVPSPAHRLVALGYDAVPRLIDALEDQRFTRSVGCHRSFHFKHYTLRVGDCALAVLERIAGRAFWEPTSTFSYMTMDKMSAESKKKVKAWYAELQKKGEKRLLIEATERGDKASYEQAKLLVSRYPDAALPAIVAGVEAAADGWTRGELVAVTAEIKDDGPVAFLLREAKEGRFAYSRFAAARCLDERGLPDGLDAMIAEWRNQRPKSKPLPGYETRAVPGLPPGPETVAGFLATSGKVEAIEALAKDLLSRPADLRMEVISALGTHESLSMVSSGAGAPLRPSLKRPRDNPEAVRAAAVDLLVDALDDTEEVVGVSGSWDGKEFADPRICDVAGHVLSQVRPEVYRFDLSAPLAVRNRDIVGLKNAWRSARGLEPLPLPAAPVVDAVPAQTLRPLLDQLAGTGGGRTPEAEARIEALGPGALPGILERLRDVDKDAPARASLERLSRRVACVVSRVEVAEKSVRPDAALTHKLEAMKGRPFEPDDFREAVRSLAKKLPEGVPAVRFSVTRDGDGTGITLTVDLLDAARTERLARHGWIARDPSLPKDVPSFWNCDVRVRLGRKSLLNSSGVTSHAHLLSEGEDNLRRALREACSGEPREPIDARLQLVASWSP
jgi:hypothetical protein